MIKNFSSNSLKVLLQSTHTRLPIQYLSKVFGFNRLIADIDFFTLSLCLEKNELKSRPMTNRSYVSISVTIETIERKLLTIKIKRFITQLGAAGFTTNIMHKSVSSVKI